MKKVTGIGGIFFKAQNPQALYAWYEKHLGIQGIPGQGAMFPWQETTPPHKEGLTVWSIFSKESDYFGNPQSHFMINYRVENLKDLLDSLKSQGIEVLGEQKEEYGHFAWIKDMEGNRIELWESPADENASVSDEPSQK